MLSKAKGQVLRFAAALHVLFCDTVDAQGDTTVSQIPPTISKDAIIAAQNFVDVANTQHLLRDVAGWKMKSVSLPLQVSFNE